MPFTNPIVAGTNLVIEAINSPDYVEGESGWIIRRDGSSEFSNTVVRGEFHAGPEDSRVDIDDTGIWLRNLTWETINPPGIRFATDVNTPQIIRDHYAAQNLEIASTILHSFYAFNAYWYDCVTFGSDLTGQSYRVSGYVLNTSVNEQYRIATGETAGKMLREIQSAQCTSSMTPASSTFADIVGCELSFTIPDGRTAYFEAFYAADMNQISGSNTTTVVRILNDGDADGYPQCVYNPGNTSTVTPSHREGGLAQSISGVWTAGEHTLKLQGARAEGTGTNRINTVHTNMRVNVYY